MKKMIRKRTIQFIKSMSLLFCLSLFTLDCSGQETLKELTDTLLRWPAIGLYSKFSKFGKKAIPYLINVIDKDKIGYVGFQDLRSSRIYPIHCNYVGIRAAYMVDCILANRNGKQLFYYSVIVKVIDNKPVMEALTYHDMKRIKVLYKKWWRTNKSKSLAELTEDWNKNKRPLANSKYRWE